jgi:hypothetical protein
VDLISSTPQNTVYAEYDPNADVIDLRTSNPNPSPSLWERSHGFLGAWHTRVRKTVFQRDHESRLIPKEIDFLVSPVGALWTYGYVEVREELTEDEADLAVC